MIQYNAAAAGKALLALIKPHIWEDWVCGLMLIFNAQNMKSDLSQRLNTYSCNPVLDDSENPQITDPQKY